ncbi:hypothetical protein vseg_003586 [Gypsophila vaccaria]
MEDMMEYQFDSADNIIGYSGFSDVQMKALCSGAGSIPMHLLSGLYSNSAADMGSWAFYDYSDVENKNVSPNELSGVSGLPFYCPYESTGSRRHETSLSSHLMLKEEVASTDDAILDEVSWELDLKAMFPYDVRTFVASAFVSTDPYVNMECEHAESNAVPIQAVKMEEAYGSHSFFNHEESTSNPPPRSLSRRCRHRSRAAEVESNRRTIITEKMQALRELLPSSLKAKQGDQEAIVDDAIAHVKYLQLQLKELSRSKLGGESVSAPLSFLEGYGHYHPQEQMLGEPLEELIGNLMKDGQTTAVRLLESKGIHLMPMTSVDELCSSE